MQPSEGEGQLLVAIVDQTYGVAEDDAWEREREKYRLGLETEFGVPFEEGNIGPSADFPAFITLLQTASIPNWALLISAFFLGKPINDNLSAWREMGQKIRAFFKRPTYLNRQGAAALAVERVFDELGGVPNSIHLLSYRVVHAPESDSLADMNRGDEIAEGPDTLYLGFILHIFEIDADGNVFRVSVDGRNANIVRL